VQRVDDAKSKSIVFAYDIHPRYGENILPTRLQGLDAAAKYRVKEICLMPGRQSWLPCNDKVYTGDYLMKVGIKVTSTNDLVSHIIEIMKE
jgi:alpha-galactosidase